MEGPSSVIMAFQSNNIERATTLCRNHVMYGWRLEDAAKCSSEFGRTALFYASACGARDLVRLMINSSANVNAADCFGIRPIHCAVMNGYADVLEDLIQATFAFESIIMQAGAKLDLRIVEGINEGKDALQLARDRGFLDVLRKLIRSLPSAHPHAAAVANLNPANVCTNEEDLIAIATSVEAPKDLVEIVGQCVPSSFARCASNLMGSTGRSWQWTIHQRAYLQIGPWRFQWRGTRTLSSASTSTTLMRQTLWGL